MSESNNLEAKREWQQAIQGFDVVFIPLKIQALTRFVHLFLDYLLDRDYDPSLVVETVCRSLLFPSDQEASALNEAVVETLKQIIASYESSIDVEE